MGGPYIIGTVDSDNDRLFGLAPFLGGTDLLGVSSVLGDEGEDE